MTEEIDRQFKNIQEKLHQLVKLYQVLQKENLQLKKELEKSQLQSEKNSGELQVLQQKLDVLSLGVSKWNGSDKADLQKRIDVYLKEIDKCLGILNAE